LSFKPQDLVVVGLGQLGVLFGEAAMKAGRRVTPVRRDTDVERALDDVPCDAPLLLAVGERDLEGALAPFPKARWAEAILVQNELFPRVWQAAGLDDPTVAVVWLSKKAGSPVELGAPSQVYGKHAALLKQIHGALNLPCEVLATKADRDRALVAKFAFILAINALGLEHNLSLGDWLVKDRPRVLAVIDDARRLGEAHLGHAVDKARVQAKVEEAMRGLSHYPARGRTAKARLERAHKDAAAYSLSLPALLGDA
jgi:hypothetical protein